MRKLKTRRSVWKRIKVTSTGKLMRRKCGKSHLLTKKSRKRKRHLREEVEVDSSWRKKVKPALPYSF